MIIWIAFLCIAVAFDAILYLRLLGRVAGCSDRLDNLERTVLSLVKDHEALMIVLSEDDPTDPGEPGMLS